MLRRVFTGLFVLLCIVAPTLGDEGLPKLRVVPGGWGKVSEDDIAAVCESVIAEFCGQFPGREWEPIALSHNERGPMVIYGLGESGERRVWLNTQDTYWSQYAFQFSHECCHIACRYRDGNKANHWFEESLCETASLFTLRRMATVWKTKPPYSNWKDYSKSLEQYAADRLAATEQLEGQSLAQWYRAHEATLRKNSTDRAKNQIVAAAILPLLEKEPQHWQAVAYLNEGDAERELSFAEHLRGWHERVPDKHKPFVAEVAKLFEIAVK